MCGRFSLGADATTLTAQFALFEAPAWTPRYNIAATQEILVVVGDPTTATRQARWHRWGLIPSWAKDLRIGSQLINAQAETAAAKPAFRKPLRERRYLIPADGFYEWAKEGRHKKPYSIRLRDGRPLCLCGAAGALGGPRGHPHRLLHDPQGYPQRAAAAPAPPDGRDLAGQRVRPVVRSPYLGGGAPSAPPASVPRRRDDGLPGESAGEQPSA